MSRPVSSPSPSAEIVQIAYRDGVVGRPSSITPLTARTRADRDLVALVFRGLVRLGPGQTLSGDLADSWTVGGGGKTYTFTIRPDATWQDGIPVTAEDVVFTVGMLKDPDYTGPEGASWSDVKAEAVDGRTVQFTLGKPIAGFLQLATQPLLPAHLLRDTSVKDLADSAYARDPVGDGPYRIVERDFDRAILEPVDDYAAPPDPSAAATAVPSTGASAPASPGESAPAAPSATVVPTATADIPVDLAAPGLARIELRFYDDETALEAAFRAGDLDAASGVDPTTGMDLASIPGARLVKYPSAIFTSVTFNLRPDHPKFGDRRFRRAVVQAIDREAIVRDLLGGGGAIAETPIPPASWAFSAAASRALPYDVTRAASELTKAGWKKTAKGWIAPKATKPFALEILALDKATNPLAFAIATRVAKDLTAFGFRTTVVGPRPVRPRAAPPRARVRRSPPRCERRPGPGPLPAPRLDAGRTRRVEHLGDPERRPGCAPRRGPEARLARGPEEALCDAGRRHVDRAVHAAAVLPRLPRRLPGHGRRTPSEAARRPQ